MRRIALTVALLLMAFSTAADCQQTLWTRYIGGPVYSSASYMKVTHNDSIIVFGDKLSAISRHGGRVLWNSPVDAFITYFDVSPDDSFIVCRAISGAAQDTCS